MKKLIPLLIPTLLLALACAPIERAVVVEPPAVEPQPAAEAQPVMEAAPAQEAAPAEPASPSPTADATDAHDPATAPLDAVIPFDPSIRTGTFDNGLKYYIRVNHKPENRADLRLLINAGSLQEDDDQLGLAHFVEHMAFNGTEKFEKQEIVDYLESIGMRFGADLNAYTSFDETVYMLTLPTDDAGIVDRGFEILAEWAAGVAFDGEEIDKERGIVVEEWRLGLGAGSRIRDQQFPILFKDSRYAERLTIGEKEIIENAPHDAIRRFYRDWYRPDLMAVVAVGDFDPDDIEARIKNYFAPLPAAEDPRPREVYPVPPHPETLMSRVTDPELSRTNVSVLYKHPAQSEGSYGNYRRSLVQSLYHGMLNARLNELTQLAEPPFLYGFSSMGAFVRSATVFSQQAGVRDGEVVSGLEALLTEVERVDRHGFTASELERIKTNVLRGYEQAYRERDKLRSGSLAAEYGRNFLEGEPVPGIAVELQLAQRFLPSIELEEVNRLAGEWITDENRVILVTGPEKEGATLPAEDEILAVFDALAERDVEPFVDQVRDEPLLAEIPEPGEIVETKTVDELGVTEWQLSNGVRVILKPTDFKNDQVLLTGWSPGGHSLVADQDHTSAIFATTILGESGLGEFSQIELGKALAGKVAQVGPYISELEEGFSGAASPEDLETFFQLLYLHATAPRFEQEAFESLMAKMKIVIQNRLSRPQTVFGDRMSEVLTQGHPRRRPMSEEVLAEVDPEKALAVYRDRFADAGDFTFILVGNFVPSEIEPLVRTYLGGLPASGREEDWRDIGVRRPDGVVKVEVKKGLEPKSRVSLLFSGEAPWSREEQHLLSSLGQALRIRFREVLREDLGATYGVSVGGGLSPRPIETYSFSVGFGCSPEEVDSLVTTVFDEIAAVKENGIDETYVSKVQEIQRRKRETDLKENGFWLRGLQTYYSRGLDPRLLLTFDQLIDGLSAERMQQAARRYLDPERYVLGVHHPEAASDP